MGLLNKIKEAETERKVQIRPPNEDEFVKVFQFMEQSMPDECYAEYFYKIMLRYFRNTCFIAQDNELMVGFILGYFSQVKNTTYFLWQIAVLPAYQGKGVGKKLIQAMEQTLKLLHCEQIEVTIGPANRPSQKLFESMGYNNISEQEGEVVMVNNNSAVKDYYKTGRHFMLYSKVLKT